MTVIADPENCSFQFDPVGKSKFVTSLRYHQEHLGQCRRALSQRSRAVRHHRARPRRRCSDAASTAAVCRSRRAGDGEEGGVRRDVLKRHAAPKAGYQARKPNPAAVDTTKAILVLLVFDHRPRQASMACRRRRWSSHPDPHPLLRFIGAVSHRCRLVRRLAADNRCSRSTSSTGNIYAGLWYPVIVAWIQLRRGAVLPAGNARPRYRSLIGQRTSSGTPGSRLVG